MSSCLSLSCSVGEELRLGLAGARLPMAANSSLLLPLPLLASHRFEGAAAERPPVRSMRATKVTSLVESSAALSRGFLISHPTPQTLLPWGSVHERMGRSGLCDRLVLASNQP